ncbi:MAG TPA: hypothetical protein VGI64_02410 [Streptosporangiaceae bacterium]|jgi:hypothetical protein
MPERDPDPQASADLPTTTGEFRARPDISASTAQFRAFASGAEGDTGWSATRKASSTSRIAVIGGIVAVVVVIIVIVALVG